MKDLELQAVESLGHSVTLGNRELRVEVHTHPDPRVKM